MSILTRQILTQAFNNLFNKYRFIKGNELK